MEFALTEEQEELASIVRELLSEESGAGVARESWSRASGYNESLWQKMCGEIGVASLAIPEEYGGAGFSYLETHLVLEELGRALTASPFFGSAVLAAQTILSIASHEEALRLLPGVASGTTIAALAWATKAGRWDPTNIGVTASEASGTWSVRGEAPLVLFGAQADLLLTFAQTDNGLGLFEVAADEVSVQESSAMDSTLRFATVTWDGHSARLLGRVSDEQLHALWNLVAAGISALQIGGASACLELTVEYSQQRVQFGRTIGSFQALKHRMAEMYVSVETATTASRAVAIALTTGEEDASELARLAKIWCSEAFLIVAGEMIQLHGGIAITWEHDAHLFFKRSHAMSQLFGSPRELRRSVESALSLA